MTLYDKDFGIPLYAIIMFHKEHDDIPKLAVRQLSLVVTYMQKYFQETFFKHESSLCGGDAMIYSITLAPYEQTKMNHINKLLNVVDNA